MPGHRWTDRQAKEDRQTYRQTNTRTDRQTDMQTGRQANNQLFKMHKQHFLPETPESKSGPNTDKPG